MRRPRLGGVLLAIVGGAVAILVLGYASQPENAQVTTTTSSNLVVAPPDTSPPTSSTTAPPVDPPPPTPLTELLPGADGELVSVVTTATGTHRLLTQSDFGATVGMPPMPDRPTLEFDTSDLRLAFLGASSMPEGNPLYVGRPLSWQPIASQVSSFAWHTSVPGRLGWMEFGQGLCAADVHVNGAFVTEPVCDPEVAGELVGFDDHGALLITGTEVTRVADGEEVGRVPGMSALPAPDGRVLITSFSPAERGVVFDLASPDLKEVDRLDWAPADALGLYGFVAWSPRVTAPELAFLVRQDAERHQIQRWDLDGNLLNSLNLGSEAWEITWDRSGRFLLAPGLSNGQHFVHVYDLSTNELTYLPFDHWVEDTHLVIPAFCEDASGLVDHWQETVSDGVTVVDMWMVSSRDSGLVSWRFVSGRLIGGARDGEIATWAIPDYPGEGPPPRAIPANEPAMDPPRDPTRLDLGTYGIEDWMLVDGAGISQWCLAASDD